MMNVLRCGMALTIFWAGCVSAPPEDPRSGAELFAAYCAGCHPDGGNVVTPQRTLRRLDREANGVVTPADVVKKMRQPGAGMKRFPPEMIGERDALKIGEYVVATFR